MEKGENVSYKEENKLFLFLLFNYVNLLGAFLHCLKIVFNFTQIFDKEQVVAS